MVVFLVSSEKTQISPLLGPTWKKSSDAHVRIMCGTKHLNPFFRLHEASEVLKYVIGVWSNNFTAAFFVSLIMTSFVSDIEGIQNRAICV